MWPLWLAEWASLDWYSWSAWPLWDPLAFNAGLSQPDSVCSQGRSRLPSALARTNVSPAHVTCPQLLCASTSWWFSSPFWQAPRETQIMLFFSSVQLHSCVWLFATHGLRHARLPCPSPTPRACWNSCPPSWWCRSHSMGTKGCHSFLGYNWMC